MIRALDLGHSAQKGYGGNRSKPYRKDRPASRRTTGARSCFAACRRPPHKRMGRTAIDRTVRRNLVACLTRALHCCRVGSDQCSRWIPETDVALRRYNLGAELGEASPEFDVPGPPADRSRHTLPARPGQLALREREVLALITKRLKVKPRGMLLRRAAYGESRQIAHGRRHHADRQHRHRASADRREQPDRNGDPSATVPRRAGERTRGIRSDDDRDIHRLHCVEQNPQRPARACDDVRPHRASGVG